MKTKENLFLVIMPVIVIILFVSVLARAACSLPERAHIQNIIELSGLLPGDTRGVLAIDLKNFMTGNSSAAAADRLRGYGFDEALDEPFGAIEELSENIDLAGVIDTALLVQTTNASDGLFLIARLACDTIGEVTQGPDLSPDGTYGTGNRPIYIDGNGNSLTLMAEGVLVIGKRTAVQLVLDLADGAFPASFRCGRDVWDA